MSEVSAEDLPALIKSFRQKVGMTQVEFARTLGITPTSVHRYEAGTSSPSLAVLRELATVSWSRNTPEEARTLQTILEERTKQNAIQEFKRQARGRELSKILPPEGSRLLLNVTFLATISNAEHDALEAALALLRSEDQNWKEVLRAVLRPWIGKLQKEGQASLQSTDRFLNVD